MNWTDERVELLRKLWSEGLSASQIAAQLGGVSRNAVIGKVHRLKLSSRGRAAPAQTRQKRAPKPAGAPKSAPRASSAPARHAPQTIGATALKVEYDVDAMPITERKPQQDVVVPIARRLKLVDLSERTCKWPIGDPLDEEFHFCGHESGESGPYCQYHARLAFQPASERRRR